MSPTSIEAAGEQNAQAGRAASEPKRRDQRPCRIAFVSTMSGAPWGGSEELWSQAALRLKKLGHEVHASVLLWPTAPARVRELGTAGVQLKQRPRCRGRISRLMQSCLRRFSDGPLDFLEMRWLRAQSPDLVVISQGGPWDGVPWMLACLRLGLPYCFIVQANTEAWWPSDDRLDDIREAFGKARRGFFVSRSNRELTERQCGVRLANGEVVMNPLNVTVGSEVPWPPDSGDTHLACVARLDPAAKGQDLILQVLAQEKWRRRPVQVHFYGSGGSETSVRALAALLQLGNAHFHGHVNDVSRVWAESHALVLPSRFEGLPLTLVEAMLCGRPPVTTDVAGNTELVRDGVNGFVAAAPTYHLLDDALERAWARRAEWKSIGRRARQDALAAMPSDPAGEFARKVAALALEQWKAVASLPVQPSKL